MVIVSKSFLLARLEIVPGNHIHSNRITCKSAETSQLLVS